MQGLDLETHLRSHLASASEVAATSRRLSTTASAGSLAPRRIPTTFAGLATAALELLLQVLTMVDLALALGGSVEGQFDVAGSHVDEVQEVDGVVVLLLLLMVLRLLTAVLRSIQG